MRIAWFTPFDIKSAIGRVGRDICEELHRHYEVDIWTACKGELIKTDVNIIKFQPDSLDTATLKQYDHVVFNMGNYAGFHKPIWMALKEYGGIVILHDQTMHNLFYQMLCIPEFGGDPKQGYAEYLNLMQRFYGKQAVAAANAVWKDHIKNIDNSDLAAQYQLFQPLLEHSKAIFTHARFFADKLKDDYYGPIAYSYLPIKIPQAESDISLPKSITNEDGKLLIVSTGIVHPVKRIDKVTDALLKNPDLCEKVKYVVIGDSSGHYGDELRKLAKGPLKDCLYLLGYQSNAVLEASLLKADICINLRYPNSEVCSYSLLEQMASSKPVIVINKGVYGEMPDDAVYKISLENEGEELEAALRNLIQSESLRKQFGQNARNFVEENCSVQTYAENFLKFLGKYSESYEASYLTNVTLSSVNTILKELGFNHGNVPWTMNAIIRQFGEVLLANRNEKDQPGKKVLGIWAGFTYKIPGLNREGIMRFLAYMVQAMMKHHNIDCEIWAYSFNEEEMRLSFNNSLSDPEFENRINIITEKNWMDVFETSKIERFIPYEVDEIKDNLCEIARQYSKAYCFVPAIIYLDNVIGTDKPIFVPVHDMVLNLHYESFTRADPNYKARVPDISARAEHLARSGAFMFSNCDTVRRGQLLKFVKNIREDRTDFVYLPTNIPKDIENKLLFESDIRQKFLLNHPYLFYATQVRPYKNVSLLIRAMAMLVKKGIEIDLVLTGRPADVPEVQSLIEANHLESKIICISNVSEGELYSIYSYASAVAVPTLFEGGLPWQACEALYMNVPTLLSTIPIVKERIESMGFTMENCGLELFDPNSPEELAEKLEKVLNDRQGTIQKQQKFRDKLCSYTWKDAAAKYYSMFFEGGKPNA
jgi:glycosyltransferase involved in cell wall biosynthesis